MTGRAAAPLVGIIMGSQSDWPTMAHTAEILDLLKISYEKKVVSAHRTPDPVPSTPSTPSGPGARVCGAGSGADRPGRDGAIACRRGEPQ